VTSKISRCQYKDIWSISSTNIQGSTETVGHNSNSVSLSKEPSCQTILAQNWVTITYFCCEIKVNREDQADKSYSLEKCLIVNT